MAFTSRTRLVNPRLGTYFGIYTSAFIALFMLALILEQLGVSDGLLRTLMCFGPLILYGGIGILSPAQSVGDFFASGRRVPAFFTGSGLAVSTLGGYGLLAITGAFLVMGVDAFALSLGLTAGLVFMGVLITPFLRKFGAYTLPTYFGRRFESKLVRLAAAAILGVPLLLLVVAEARFAAYAASWLLGQSERLMAAFVVLFVSVILALGGMRAMTWSSVAKCILMLLALAVPVTIVAILISKIPVPQMTHGNVLMLLTRAEAARGVPFLLAPSTTVDLPGTGGEPLIKRFVQPFGTIGSFGFVVLTFTVACGVAASPSLLGRAGTTPGVYETRKASGWAVLITGLVLMTLPAVVVYFRYMLLDQVVGSSVDHLPGWFKTLQDAGIAKIEAKTQLILLSQISFERDATLFSLPIAAGMPQVLIYLALAGALAAALAALSSSVMAAAAILSEDVVAGLIDEDVPDRARLLLGRLAIAVTGFVAMWITIVAPGDPMELATWALNILASACFPVLFLSIWWKRTNAWGALLGMIVGFVLSILIILLAETSMISMSSMISAVIAGPCALISTLVATLLTPVPGRTMLDVVRDIRVPGGETVYDREMRIHRLKTRVPS